jgi:phosphoglycerate dehydrogenase-like enzyme
MGTTLARLPPQLSAGESRGQAKKKEVNKVTSRRDVPVRLAILIEHDIPDLGQMSGVEVRIATSRQLPGALRGADALLVWDFAARGLAEAWRSADRLRWLHVNSAGVDTVLVPEVIASDVTITNASGVLDQSLAEYVVGLVLALAKDLHGTLDRQRNHRWEHRPTRRLAGGRALVVGLGGIGRATARLLGGLGLHVDAVARTARAGDGDVGVVHAVEDLTAVVGQYDVVVLAAPLTAATRGLVDLRVLDAMDPDALLVNVGRGALLDEQALLDTLLAGRLGGVALDVFEEEPLPADHPLWAAPRTVISPHMSGDYLAWEQDLLNVFTDNLARFRAGQPLRNLVDKRLVYVPRNDSHPAGDA